VPVDHPILHVGNAQRPYSALGLGDLHCANRRRAVLTPDQLSGDGLPMTPQVFPRPLYIHTIHPGWAAIGFHRMPRRRQVLLLQYRFDRHRFRVLSIVYLLTPYCADSRTWS